MTRMRELEAELRRIGAGYSGRWTACVADLVSGERLAIDDDVVMPTASLIKVPVLAALYRAADEGRFALDDPTTYEESHYCRGSGVLQHLTPGVVQMTIRDAAVLMMIISDNAATNMCIDLAGLDFVNETMESIGCTRTKIFQRLGDPKAGLDPRKMNVSIAGDIVRLMSSIARHECVSDEASEDMMRIMRRMNGRAELSRLLPWNEMNMLDNPRENWVAEKGGAFINGVRTGGAIFHSDHGHFVMSVFAEGGLKGGTAHNAEGNVLLGEMGKAAWDALA
jgi:beta-lactamase class A